MASLEQYLNVPPRAYRGSGRRTKAALVLILLAWVGGFLVHSRGPGTPRINFIPGDPEASRGPVSLAVVARWCHAQPTIGPCCVCASIHRWSRTGSWPQS